MIERAIESWLTNTNEENYQIPFCQVLLSRGHRILYISPHSLMEQGKDVISLGPDGNCYAYQLKTGKIGLSEWRKIRGEVGELIELPVVHPSVNTNKIHKSFVVTNGDVNDTVRIQITQINDDNTKKGRNYSYLDVINLQTLVKDFVDAQGSFIPQEPKDFKTFLELYLGDGTDFLDKGKYTSFLENSIFYESVKSPADVLNAVYSSVILTSYILKPYQGSRNHFAQFEAWITFQATILRFGYAKGVQEKDLAESIALASKAAEQNIENLWKETRERKDFLEGAAPLDGGYVYRARATILLGTLCAMALQMKESGPELDKDRQLLPLVQRSVGTLASWGESAFPFFFNIIKYLESLGAGNIAADLLVAFTTQLLAANSKRGGGGIANPYYSANDVLKTIYSIADDPIDFQQFGGTSCILESLVEMFARRGLRDQLSAIWRQPTHMRFSV